MIKWLLSYLKFSKLFWIGFLISCFMLLGSFVSAYEHQLTVFPAWNYQESPYDSNVNFAVYSRGMFWSNSLWFTNRMFVFSNTTTDKSYLFWNNNRLYLYYYDSYNRVDIQWHVSQYSICDSFDSTTHIGDLSNCSSFNFDNAWYNVVSDFLSKYTSQDYYAIWKWYYFQNYRNYYLTICFNSAVYWKSLCFSNSHWLDSSLNLDDNLSFFSVWSALIGDPPGWSTAWDNIQWGSNTVENSSLTWNLLYSTCTNWFLLWQLDKQLWWQWRYTCNAWINDTWIILDQQSMLSLNNTPWQWVDFKTVYSLTKEWLSWWDWFSKYSNMYNQWFYNQNVYSSNPFFWKNAVLFSYFKILNDYGYNDYIYSYDILNGCKLLLYSDWNAEYNWSYFSNLCSNMVWTQPTNWWSYSTWEVGNVDSDWEVLPPWYNNWWSTSNWGNYSSSSWVVVGADWSWVNSWNNQKSYDSTTFINDYFQKLKSTYIKPWTSGSWTLPAYIVVFLCAIILFRFLRK